MALTFPDIARRAFVFLEGMGFTLVSCGETALRYQSSHSVVAIGWDRRSGEIDVSIGLPATKAKRETLYSLADVINMQGIDGLARRKPYEVPALDRIAPFLQKLAEDTKTHAHAALVGDRMFFRRVETFCTAQGRAYVRQMEVSHARAAADKAWRDKDLSTVISAYTSIDDALTPSERKKLEYALRRR